MQEISLYAKKNSNSKIFKEIAWLSSSELISAGIDINFAPVLDLDKNSSSIFQMKLKKSLKMHLFLLME